MTIVYAKPPAKRPRSTGPRSAALVNGSCIVHIPRKTKQERAQERWQRAAAAADPEKVARAGAWIDRQLEKARER